MPFVTRLVSTTLANKRLAILQNHVTASCQSYFSPRKRVAMSTTTAAASNSSVAAKTPTSAALGKLEKVMNARDLASATPRIAPGRFFRSGNPSLGTLEDVKTLRLDLGIKQMLDFRSSEEHAEDTGWSLMLSNGEITTYDQDGNITSVAIDHNAQLKGVDLPDCQLHRLSLLEKDRFIKALMWYLPTFKVAQAIGYKVLGYKEQMRDVLVPEINKGGLPLVNKILLETAAADIRRSLEVITDGAQCRFPQLIFCRLGKDRTGLMAALVLACCGATDEEIIRDYALSDGVDAVALGGLEKMKETQGMESSLFASAPPEVMEQVLAYAKEKYGGMKQYMTSIGFSQEQQQRLAKALSAETEWK